MKKPILSVTMEDCEMQVYKGTGAGGQAKNKTSNCVRIIHKDSGARGESCQGRSQLENKKNAFRKMAESKEFKRWIRIKTIGETPEERVEKDMDSQNLLIEVRGEDGWEKM